MHMDPPAGVGGELGRAASDGRLAIMVGDRVGGETVTGFAYVPASGRGYPAPEDDRLLVEEDDDPQAPPDRPVPAPVPGAEFPVERCGRTPLQLLPDDRQSDAKDIAEHLENSVRRAVFGAPPEGRFHAELQSRVAGMGHQMWLAGGAVRDLIADGADANVHDLDFSGTVPPGLMSATAHAALVRSGIGDCRPRVSEGMVCSIKLIGRKDRLLEYKPLTLKRYRFPAFGGDLQADAQTRDLTVNTLLFDLQNTKVLDPLGRGLVHLRARPRVLEVPYAHNDPVELATIVLRAIKFVTRWSDAGMDLHLEKLHSWIGRLPADLVASIPSAAWPGIHTARRFTFDGIPAERQRRTADELGPVPGALIAELDAQRSGR